MVVALYANSIIKGIIDTTVLNESAAYSSITESFANINQYTVQRGFILFFGLMIVGLLVSGFLIRVHPAFLFIYIIFLGLSIFVAVYLSNTYEIIVSNAQFAEIADNYAMITFVMRHAIKILIGVGALSMIIIFGKVGGGGSQSSDFG